MKRIVQRLGIVLLAVALASLAGAAAGTAIADALALRP